MTLNGEKRGWVEVVEGWGRETVPFQYEPRFQVYDWTEDKGAGTMVADFAARSEAIAFAVNWAVTHGRKLQAAEVSNFPMELKTARTGSPRSDDSDGVS